LATDALVQTDFFGPFDPNKRQTIFASNSPLSEGLKAAIREQRGSPTIGDLVMILTAARRFSFHVPD
jgi:hypothetical protein